MISIAPTSGLNSHTTKHDRKPSKIVRAITNPSFGRLFEYKEPDPNTKRIQDFKVAALFGAPNIDLSKGTINPQTFPLGPPPSEAVQALPDPYEPLFNPELVSVEVEVKLPEGYRLRPLERADYNRGFLMVQSCLSSVGHVSEESWNERIEFLKKNGDTYYVLCMVDGSGTVVCTGMLMVEKKFVHGMGSVGHLQDIAVAKNQHGKNLGFRMLTALDCLAKQVGCYKTVVVSSELNEAFHAQAGFRRRGLEMSHHHLRD
ncbi:MAG: Glucosamine-phosphate N-acetyltransferase-like protein [Bathelium mastoideum]|nr:MAG: Glucosamine-phosphate N-acetyltransferase-like protein [Bathelium mastoideum]KAI9691832.1 MAG: Glucosamine-phosphate N-acetyltransferase-like protein [Bathelium mastoideum]